MSIGSALGASIVGDDFVQGRRMEQVNNFSIRINKKERIPLGILSKIGPGFRTIG